MARDHARLLFEMWTNPDFIALSARGQRMYMLMLSQPTMSYAGVLPLQLKRWASLSPDTSPQSVRAAISDLEAARFVVVDEDTEEVMIRSYMRHDGILKNPNVAKAAATAFGHIASQALRQVWLRELVRLHHERGPEPAKAWTDPKSSPVLGVLVERGVHEIEPPPADTSFSEAEETPTEPPSEPLPGRGPEPLPEPLFEGGFPRARAPEGAGVGAVLIGEVVPKAALSGADAPADNTQSLVGEWIAGCNKRPPGNVIGQISKQIKNLIDEGISPADVRAGLDRWKSKNVHPSVLPSIVNEVMNSTPKQSRSTTDDRVMGWYELANNMEAA